MSPWSNALSSNVVQLAPNVVQRGNPFLKSQQVFSNNLTYSFNNKYFGFKPSGNSLLVVKTVIAPTSESNGALIKNDYLGNYFVVSPEYKSFSVQYQVNIPVYSLSGAFLNTNESQNHIFVSYKHKNWTFSIGMYWIGMPSGYKTKSLPESLVDYRLHTQMMNNKPMFILGLSYDFSKGKERRCRESLIMKRLLQPPLEANLNLNKKIPAHL
ncbi:hypothetical protein OWR28_05345 [Chryseobacterium sp. 1B4]